MLSFIILVIVALILGSLISALLKLVRPLFALHRVYRDVRNAARQADADSRHTQHGPSAHDGPRKPRKKIDAEAAGAEYVAFEDIACNIDLTDAQTGQTVHYETEEQIVDAEWEELK